jgi:uncharacterized beta-barrel protein YwiB (DUF1934 family)
MIFGVTVKEYTHRVLTEPADEQNGANTNFIEKASFATTQYETVCDGTLVVEETRVCLSYEPTDQISVEMCFEVNEPKLITLRRRSDSMPPMTLVLEEGVRHVCLCKSKSTSIEMMARAKRIDNSFLKDGRVELDYTVEVNGLRAEKTKMRINLIKNERLR